MATIKTSGDLLSAISSELADNNAGLISASDVRHNMEDTVASISLIVASGDTNLVFPFTKDVKAKVQGGSGGTFIAESGLMFPNAPTNSEFRQVEPFLGVGNLSHNDLADLDSGDEHTQYTPINGSRKMTGSLGLGSSWIGASGSSAGNNFGMKFVRDGDRENILTSGRFVFPDNSRISSGRGVAKAWINFDASGVAAVPVVRSAYNITKLEDLGTGKFRVTFASGIIGDDSFVAVCNSNATSASGSMEDFDVNTVGIVARSGVDPNKTATFAIRNDAGQYIDAEINELVVFSNGPSVTTDSVTVS